MTTDYNPFPELGSLLVTGGELLTVRACIALINDKEARVFDRDEAIRRLCTTLVNTATTQQSDSVKYSPYIDAAAEWWATDDIELDDHPFVAPADDGVWVNGWFWVAHSELES